MREHPIIFSGAMVRAILEGRKDRRRLYVRNGEDPNAPEQIARRLANGLDSAPPDGCWEWVRARNNAGYGTLTICGRRTYAHRLAYQLAGNKLEPDDHVLHACDNPACINPDHLRAGTQSDNMQDAFQKGRLRTPRVAKFGSTNPAAKLDEATVRSIRRLLNQHWTQREIAERHGISQSQVSNIARGRQWRRAK